MSLNMVIWCHTSMVNVICHISVIDSVDNFKIIIHHFIFVSIILFRAGPDTSVSSEGKEHRTIYIKHKLQILQYQYQ